MHVLYTYNTHCHAHMHTATTVTTRIMNHTAPSMKHQQQHLATKELLYCECVGGIMYAAYLTYLSVLQLKGKNVSHLCFLVSKPSCNLLVCLHIPACVDCPETFQIQADVPKRGQRGGRSGKVWEGGRRTVQQVTFEPFHHNTDNP